MNVVTFGEIMLRLSPPGKLRFSQAGSFDAVYGGGEANVAVSLANYGIAADFVTRIPKNDIGDACIMDLRKHGVGTQHILRGGERLGIYFIEKGAVNRPSNVIYDRAYSALATIEPGTVDWNTILEGVSWFHWTGITPALSQSAATVCEEGIRIATAKGITVSCDLNYRAKLWKYGKKASDVMPGLVAQCDIVIGNEEDAEKCLSIKPEGVDISSGTIKSEAYRAVSQAVMKKFPKVKKVATTLRTSFNADHNGWSGVLYNSKELLTAPSYDITDIIDRVGGGDSFTGGLIYGLLARQDDRYALDFATAASCLKHTIVGDCNLVSVAEVEKLMAGESSGRVAR